MPIYNPIKATIKVELTSTYGEHRVIERKFFEANEANHCMWAIDRLLLWANNEKS